jgi:LAO/AO transport system kinase
MEVADVFALNKSDRDGASIFLKNLQSMVHEQANEHWETPVISTQATHVIGIDLLWEAIQSHSQHAGKDKKEQNLKEKAWRFLSRERLQPISEEAFFAALELESKEVGFNLYAFVSNYSKKHPLI